MLFFRKPAGTLEVGCITSSGTLEGEMCMAGASTVTSSTSTPCEASAAGWARAEAPQSRAAVRAPAPANRRTGRRPPRWLADRFIAESPLGLVEGTRPIVARSRVCDSAATGR